MVGEGETRRARASVGGLNEQERVCVCVFVCLCVCLFDVGCGTVAHAGATMLGVVGGWRVGGLAVGGWRMAVGRSSRGDASGGRMCRQNTAHEGRVGTSRRAEAHTPSSTALIYWSGG